MDCPQLRVLIVGGYGVFGARLVQLLDDEPRLELLVGGRSIDVARKLCAERAQAAASLLAVVFDRAADIDSQLADLRPGLVVDASGPFQAYGSTAYRLVESCIRLGIDYLDLADGSDFVAGIARFDAAAQAAGVFALSGVSSFPVLTAAVVRRLASGMTRVNSICGGIAPSPYAGVGVNVIRAISSYAGQPVERRRAGRAATSYPFTEFVHYVVDVPGHIPLERRRFSLVDVPDLRVLATHWPEVNDVWMGAAPVPAPLHWMLTLLARLVRVRLMPSLAWLAPVFHFVTNHVRWGEHRGGMFVEVAGTRGDGSASVRSWHMLAEGDDGPLIPCMAIEAVVRKMLDGARPGAGARPGSMDIELSDYEKLFARRSIHTGVRERQPRPSGPLYPRLLGTAWERLPEPVRAAHSVTATSSFSGVCTVERGRNPLAWLVALCVGFPAAGADQPITVTMHADGERERWVRAGANWRFASEQTAGRGASEGLLRERFGPVSVDMAVVADDSGLRYVVRRWALFGIPMPRLLAPRARAGESHAGDAFQFDVELSHPLTGSIVRYRGRLSPSARHAQARGLATAAWDAPFGRGTDVGAQE